MIDDTINCLFNFVLHLDGGLIETELESNNVETPRCFVNGIVETRTRGRQFAQSPQCNITFPLKKLSIAGVRNLIHPNGKLRDADYPSLNEDLRNIHVRR